MGTVQTDNIGMINIEKDLFLRVKMHELVLLDNFSFAHDFQSVHLLFAFESDKLDPTKGSIAKGAQDFQIIFLQFPENLFIIVFKPLHITV